MLKWQSKCDGLALYSSDAVEAACVIHSVLVQRATAHVA